MCPHAPPHDAPLHLRIDLRRTLVRWSTTVVRKKTREVFVLVCGSWIKKMISHVSHEWIRRERRHERGPSKWREHWSHHSRLMDDHVALRRAFFPCTGKRADTMRPLALVKNPFCNPSLCWLLCLLSCAYICCLTVSPLEVIRTLKRRRKK